jgi:tRNA modification GTPase
MIGKLAGWDDTIVAPATAPGIGAIGVIRISGKRSLEIADHIFPSKKISQQPSHTLHVGYIKDDKERIDEVVISLFKAPASFTGEDVIEISCHGSMHIQRMIMELVIRKGARAAKAGEFTQRAFLNGKMDLAQAESVADLIASDTEASRKNALLNMRGGFSNDLSALRERLIRFSALIELELDFAMEDVEFADRTQLQSLLTESLQKLKALLQSFRLGNVIKNGVQVAIIGKPNAGKSTLLNALLNEDRAIVSDIAGTTRDTIEETLNINGILFRLIDTAGIRESKGDVIEDIGIQKSKANAEKADVIIHLVDMTDESDDPIDWLEPYAGKTITIHNKIDVWNAQGKTTDLANGIYLSLRDPKAAEQVKELLYTKALEDKATAEGSIVTNARHVAALQEAHNSLLEVQDGINTQLSGDLLALDIRRALHYLGEITGEVTNEDRLDYIFSKFCIGK